MSQTCPLSEMMQSCKCFPHVGKMPTLSYNRKNKVIIKKTIILNILHNIFNHRDIEVVVCIIFVLLKRANGLNHYLNNSETIVNFEPNSKPQYHLSSSVCNCVDIFREFFVTEEADLKLTMEDFTRHKISWAVKIRQLLVCVQQMKDLKPGLVNSMYDKDL